MTDTASQLDLRHQHIHQFWVRRVQTDQQMGGPHFDATLALAKQVMRRYGTPQLLDFFNKTGTGSHPELVRIFARIGQALNKAQALNDNQPPKRPKTIGELFYPGFDGK